VLVVLLLLVSDCDGYVTAVMHRTSLRRCSARRPQQMLCPPLQVSMEEGDSGSNGDDDDNVHPTGGGRGGKRGKTATARTTTATGTTGVYVRPSGAIERGSGFFVPGLEGPRIRIVIGTVLLILTAANHFLGNTMMGGTAMGSGDENEYALLEGVVDLAAVGAVRRQHQPSSSSFEEVLSVAYSLLILFQAAIEYAKEERRAAGAVVVASGGTGARSSASGDRAPTRSSVGGVGGSGDSSVILDQQWDEASAASAALSGGNDDMFRSNVQWAAASYIAMTPATQMLLLTTTASSDDADARSTPTSSPTGAATVLYRLGVTDGGSNDSLQHSSPQEQRQKEDGIRAAMRELRKSKGGRIALPLTHPTVQALVTKTRGDAAPISSTDGKHHADGGRPPRTVILQRIDDDSCWLVASDQLLASFTRGDLRWLGQLAKSVANQDPNS
jgi:hypothetical protein